MMIPIPTHHSKHQHHSQNQAKADPRGNPLDKVGKHLVNGSAKRLRNKLISAHLSRMPQSQMLPPSALNLVTEVFRRWDRK